MREKKEKKIKEQEGFTLSNAAPLELSLGALLGGASSAACARGAENSVDAANGERAKNAADAAVSSAPGERPAPAAKEAKISRVSLKRERAGRGGRTVTLVILPAGYSGDKELLAKELRKGLGCGSSIEEGTIVLQGDIADRAEAWFAKKGVAKIVKG
ncbi:MAG: translation initiation factor [Cloacibacillus sp.]